MRSRTSRSLSGASKPSGIIDNSARVSVLISSRGRVSVSFGMVTVTTFGFCSFATPASTRPSFSSIIAVR